MTLEPHELSKLFPPISEEDFDKLAADIRLHGLHQPIVRYQGKILDGNNRYRACELAKIAPKFADFNGDDAQARNLPLQLSARRPPSNTALARRMEAERKELAKWIADGQDPRVRYQSTQTR